MRSEVRFFFFFNNICSFLKKGTTVIGNLISDSASISNINTLSSFYVACILYKSKGENLRRTTVSPFFMNT